MTPASPTDPPAPKGSTSRTGGSSASDAKTARRARAEALRAEREAAARRSERRTRLLIALAVLAAVAIVAVAVVSTRGGGGGADAAVPTGVSAPDGGVVRGAGNPVQMEEWIDFQCPACKSFHETFGATIDELVESGEVEFVVRPLSFLLTGSKRAANAYGCAVDAGRGAEYYDQVFTAQTAESEPGFTNEQLIALAEPAGITGDALETFTQCVEGGTYDGWVANVADAGTEAGITATPTVYVNGDELSLGEVETPDDLRQVIEDAAAA